MLGVQSTATKCGEWLEPMHLNSKMHHEPLIATAPAAAGDALQCLSQRMLIHKTSIQSDDFVRGRIRENRKTIKKNLFMA